MLSQELDYRIDVVCFIAWVNVDPRLGKFRDELQRQQFPGTSPIPCESESRIRVEHVHPRTGGIILTRMFLQTKSCSEVGTSTVMSPKTLWHPTPGPQPGSLSRNQPTSICTGLASGNNNFKHSYPTLSAGKTTEYRAQAGPGRKNSQVKGRTRHKFAGIIPTLIQVTNFSLVSAVDPWENPNIIISHNSYPAGFGVNGKGDS